MKDKLFSLREHVSKHLKFIYPELETSQLCSELLEIMDLNSHCKKPKRNKNNWNAKDILAITYGDSILSEEKKPLQILKQFFDHHFKGLINGIHILPFYPWSSDDGFAVIDYRKVNQKLGDWDDIEAISRDYKLMADLVVNHCSSHSEWFERFKQGKSPENEYFFTASPDDDLSEVVRPRTNDLLQAVETAEGTRHVWCTFSHDQVDLNFTSIELLKEIVSIINFYMEHGVQIFRLDAIAFLWKEIGTNCINLPQTHEMVRLFRTLIEHKNPKAIIITETNIPNRENLSYFGNANEAHVIYNFALPPLLLHALITGNNYYLNHWLMCMPPAQDGTTYLNFIASHDGIGLRPVEGILSDEEIEQMTDLMQQFGGGISWRKLSAGKVKPYEINISLYDALSGTVAGHDEWQMERFICAHAIMLGLEGIPAFYIQSLLGTRNDAEKMRRTGNNRAINRHNWDCSQLDQLLSDPESDHTQILDRLKHLIRIRRKHKAFHPNATQYTLYLGEGIFAFWRQSRKRDQSIFCIYNITPQAIELPLSNINLIETNNWHDLISEQAMPDLRKTLTLQPYQTLWITNLSS